MLKENRRQSKQDGEILPWAWRQDLSWENMETMMFLKILCSCFKCRNIYKDCALQIGDFELVKRLINHLGCLFVDYFEIYKVNVIEWCPAHLFLPILFGIVLPLCIRYLSSLPLRNMFCSFPHCPVKIQLKYVLAKFIDVCNFAPRVRCFPNVLEWP
jgi:hypothetical protein